MIAMIIWAFAVVVCQKARAALTQLEAESLRERRTGLVYSESVSELPKHRNKKLGR